MLFVFSKPSGNLTRSVETKDAETKQGTPWEAIAKSTDPRCDPYLIWFDLTFEPGRDEKGAVGLLDPGGSIEILLELPEHAVVTQDAACRYLNQLKAKFEIGIRTNPVPDVAPQRYVCAWLPIAKLPALAVAVARGDDNLRFELATARYFSSSELQKATEGFVKRTVGATADDGSLAQVSVSELGLLGWSAKPQWRVNRWLTVAERLGANEFVGPPQQPLVAVIDDFCNHASQSLRTRVRSIWHQGHRRVVTDGSQPAAGARAAGQGADSRDELYGVVQPVRPGPEATVMRPGAATAPNERHAYSQHGRDKLTPSWSHGSAVLSMLTTSADDRPPPCTVPDGLHLLDAPSDIDFIQLPDVTVLDTSGGSLSGFALDALHRALFLACDPSLRPAVIVNLSFGTHSGPHDGTSMFELALKELLDIFNGQELGRGILGNRRLPMLHVVLPAGNTQIERTHATARLRADGGSEALRWMILPDTETDSFIEIWLDDDIEGRVEIELLPPGADESKPADGGTATAVPGDVKLWSDRKDPDAEDAALHAAVIYPRTTSRGKNGRLALIAVAPTQQRANKGQGEAYRTATDEAPNIHPSNGRVTDALGRRRMQAAPGCWTVRLTNKGAEPVQFHAWIQRHDAAPGRSRANKGYQGRQSYFVEAPGTPVNPRFTLNGIATASKPGQLWVVGAMDERGGIPLYSAAGPDRLVGARIEGPDVATVVDRSRNAPGRHVHGVFSGSRLRLGGTSIAAAVFTRMLFHALSRGGPINWCRPDKPAPPPVETAETPALAEDWMRGSCDRLRHKDDLAVSRPSCQDQPADAPGSCKR